MTYWVFLKYFNYKSSNHLWIFKTSLTVGIYPWLMDIQRSPSLVCVIRSSFSDKLQKKCFVCRVKINGGSFWYGKILKNWRLTSWHCPNTTTLSLHWRGANLTARPLSGWGIACIVVRCCKSMAHNSKWMLVMSGMAQGLALGPMMHNIFSGDMDTGVQCPLSELTDSTKLWWHSGGKGCQDPEGPGQDWEVSLCEPQEDQQD